MGISDKNKELKRKIVGLFDVVGSDPSVSKKTKNDFSEPELRKIVVHCDFDLVQLEKATKNLVEFVRKHPDYRSGIARHDKYAEALIKFCDKSLINGESSLRRN